MTFKPFGFGYEPKPVTIEDIKNNLRRWAFHGEAHVDNLWSETLKYIEQLEQKQTMEDNIVQRIDKLILGWEREYGITNKTMVDAMLEIIDLRSKLPGYEDLHTILDKQEEEIHMLRAQCLIRKDLNEKLKSGPGGIMEMKQTIANKEAEIERLQQYESMVHYIANDYIELSYEKAQCQRDDWLKRCRECQRDDWLKRCRENGSDKME